MKIRYIKYWAFAAVLGMGTVSCEDFLDRPTEDNYNESNFYQNDEQCVQGVNYLYNSPWYDFQRGFIKVGEILSGNVYEGNSPYLNFTVNGTDENLVNMSYSLWAVIGHANTVYTRLKTANASEAVKNQCMGECLAWKAMAYFYLVRSFGAVPIIHDNTAELNSGNYNSKFKVETADVYEYIIMTLEKAMELLPARGETGRIDRYCAEGLLAKVYLTKSGLPGTTTLGPFIVNNLGPKLRQTHPETRIIFGENAQWSAILGFIMGSKNYVRDILNLNPKITNFPVIAAGHGYVDPVTGKDPAIEPFSKAESKGIPVWLTEISDPTESYDATMTSGLKWAKKFHRFLCEANTGAIVWWAGAIPDGGTTEGLINIEKNRVDYEVTKRCEVFGNFSRYIPVGSKRISAQYDFEQGYMVSGYKYGDNGYTVVAINPADHEVVISLALESAQVSGALQGYVTDDTRKWEPVEAVQPADGVYTLTLPARSVVSYTGTVLSSSSL